MTSRGQDRIMIWKDGNVPKIDAEKAGSFIRGIFTSFIEFKVA
jgi:hypothetical protein